MNVIGQWVRRGKTSTGNLGSKWHAIESVIAEAAITHCGRRLEPKASDEHSEVMPLTRMIDQPQLCKRCA